MPKLIEGRAVLIVIDMQRGGGMSFEQAGVPSMGGFEERVTRIRKLVDAARQAHTPVVFFQEIHRPDHVDFGRELDGEESVHCVEGAADTELVPELMPLPGEYLIQKRRYSCFFGTDLLILLRGLRAETLILCGDLTDVCVHYTFVDAHQHDYHARVVEDCCGGSTLARHDASLSAMEYLQRGARRSSAEILAALAP
jgi:nicotinamidase-related amidase